MYSTLKDLFLWDRALYTEKLVSKTSLKKMFTPYVHVPRGDYYGYGFHVSEIDVEGKHKKLVWHTGGGVNVICRSVEDGHTVILLNNVSTGLFHYDVAVAILKILYDQTYALPKIPVSRELAQFIYYKSVEEAILHYHQLKNTNPDLYNFDENELNVLGSLMMGRGRIVEAIEIFRLNVTEYPNSVNAHNNLADAYMKNGQKEPAIQNYRKSLELNPDNAKAIEDLKKLGVK